MNALIISANGFEDSELLMPLHRLQEEGISVDVASISRGTIIGKSGGPVEVTKTLEEVRADAYDLLVLPGGKAPQELRKEPRALAIAREFFKDDKPVAAICHGPQILISAGLLKGRHATCYRSVAVEMMREAGAIYMDEEVVVDGNLVTSRQPSDLPAFMRETLKLLGIAPREPASQVAFAR